MGHLWTRPKPHRSRSHQRLTTVERLDDDVIVVGDLDAFIVAAVFTIALLHDLEIHMCFNSGFARRFQQIADDFVTYSGDTNFTSFLYQLDDHARASEGLA